MIIAFVMGYNRESVLQQLYGKEEEGYEYPSRRKKPDSSL
jgi:hypothetical protein